MARLIQTTLNDVVSARIEQKRYRDFFSTEFSFEMKDGVALTVCAFSDQPLSVQSPSVRIAEPEPVPPSTREMFGSAHEQRFDIAGRLGSASMLNARGAK